MRPEGALARSQTFRWCESGDTYHLLMMDPLGRITREMWKAGGEKSYVSVFSRLFV
jgi:hypothetical protein